MMAVSIGEAESKRSPLGLQPRLDTGQWWSCCRIWTQLADGLQAEIKPGEISGGGKDGDGDDGGVEEGRDGVDGSNGSDGGGVDDEHGTVMVVVAAVMVMVTVTMQNHYHPQNREFRVHITEREMLKIYFRGDRIWEDWRQERKPRHCLPLC